MIKNLKIESIVTFLYAVLLIMLPFPKENAFNITLMITATLNGIYFYKEGKLIKPENRDYTIYLFINVFFFGIYVMSYFLSHDKVSAFAVVIKKAYFLAIPLIIFIGPILSEATLNKIFYYFVVNLFLLSFLGLIKSYYLYHIHFYDNYSYDTMLNALGIHLTYYGVLVVFAIYLLLQKLFVSHLKKSKIKIVFLLGFFYFFLIIMATRVNIVLGVIITLVVLFRRFEIKKSLIAFLLFLIISVSFLYLSNSYSATRFKNVFYSETGSETDLTFREIHWKSVLNSIKSPQAFLFGNTAGDKQLKLNAEYEKNNFHGAASNYNAHNQFLEVLVATGFVGLIIFLSNFSLMVYSSFKYRSFALLILQIIFLITCFTESMFERQLGIITYLTINSLVLYYLTSNKKNKVQSSII